MATAAAINTENVRKILSSIALLHTKKIGSMEKSGYVIQKKERSKCIVL